MGQLTLPASGPIYVDTSAIIYQVEQIAPFFTAAAPLWHAVDSGQIEVAVSELALLEVLVKPIRQGNKVLADLYRQVLTGAIGVNSIPISAVVLERAAQLRADFNLRTPDAIHAATALEHRCTLVVTNDSVFRRVPGLTVAVLGDFAAS